MTFAAFLRRDRFVPALMVALALIVPNTLASAASSPSASHSRSTRPAATLAPAKPSSKTTATKRSYSASVAKVRRARVAQARATARTRDLREVQTPRFTVDDAGQEVPDVRAAAAIIYNPETQQVLWQANAQEERSIASITKVMTATVFFESNPDVTQPVSITRGDVFQASTTHLRANDKVTTDDLLHLLLIASDNAAARALARVSPHGSEGFIRRMNEKAAELGLESTHYADPSGLLSDNISTAYDMARLITHAAQDDRISSIMRTYEYTVYSARRPITFHSTNHLLGRSDVDVRAGKTGFISKAGYCLATVLRLPESGQNVAVVVFGARSNAGRFMESRNLVNWVSSKASTLFATKPATPQQ
jgi:serine-type D-Ala-D-Ala endopeptidase (penicillin-binding protein 7)